MKVWITKYAFTKGILVRLVEIAGPTGKLVKVVGEARSFYPKPFWHETEAEARAHVMEMCAKKLAVLDRQRARVGDVLQATIEATEKALAVSRRS